MTVTAGPPCPWIVAEPPTTVPATLATAQNSAGAQHWIGYFVGMLSPREMGVCPGLRRDPVFSRQSIRRSFDIRPVHEQAKRFGYSNDHFVDMVMTAYGKRLDAEC